MGFGKQNTGVILRHRGNITLTTLATIAAKKADSTLTLTEDFRLIKSMITATLTDFTGGEGPILLGLADNELSEAEIAECINAAGPLDRNDNLARERAERPVWIIGQFDGAAADGVVNDGQMIDTVKQKSVPSWTFSNPEGFTLFAFNNSAALLTTGAEVRFQSTYYGVWVT